MPARSSLRGCHPSLGLPKLTQRLAPAGKDRRTPGAFIGSERTLAELKKGGTARKRVGLVVEKGAPARGKAPLIPASRLAPLEPRKS